MIIYQYLNPQDILRLCNTSGYFNRTICQDQYLWKQLYKRDISNMVNNRENYKQKYIQIFKDLTTLNLNEKLIYAARNGYEKVLQYYANNGADIHFDSELVLREASKNGHLEVVKYLVENEANVNILKDIYADGTPLELATQNDHLDVIKYLSLIRSRYLWEIFKFIINSCSNRTFRCG